MFIPRLKLIVSTSLTSPTNEALNDPPKSCLRSIMSENIEALKSSKDSTENFPEYFFGLKFWHRRSRWVMKRARAIKQRARGPLVVHVRNYAGVVSYDWYAMLARHAQSDRHRPVRPYNVHHVTPVSPSCIATALSREHWQVRIFIKALVLILHLEN